MKVVNVPGAGPLAFKDTDSDESIYETVAKIQARLQQMDLESRPDPRNIPIGRQFSNSLNRGLGGLGATGSEFMGLGAAGLGFDEAANRYLEEGKAKRQALEEKYPTSYTALDKIRGPSDFAGFVAESIGENLPNVGLMALTGGAGSLAARGAAKYGVEAAAARAAAQRGLAGEAAETYATRLGNRLAPAARSQAGETGFNVGIGAGSFGLNAPETFAGIHDETGKLEFGTAVGIGALKAALDGILPARLMAQLGLRGQAKVAEELAARSSIVPDSFKMRLAKEVGKTAATEGVTEGVQEALDIFAEQLSGAPGGFSDPKNVDRMLLAAAKGAAGGVGIGAPGALVQTMRETPAKEPDYTLKETDKAGSVGAGPAEILAAVMQKRKSGEAITEDEFQLLVQNGIFKDNPQTRASVKFAAPTTDAALEDQTNAATAREAIQNDEVANAALAQAALTQAQEANQRRQDQEIAEYQARQRAASEANIAKREAEAQDRIAAEQEAQQNVQPNTPPPPNVNPPSGVGNEVPSGPGAGVPAEGVGTPAPTGVAPVEQPAPQAGVGEGTQPPTVEVGTPAEEWNTQYRTSDAEPTFEQLPPAMRRRWMDAPAKTTELFDAIVNDYGAAAPLAKETTGILGKPYTTLSPKEIGIPGDRLALRKLKNDDKFANLYFDRPRLADNLINLAHDRVFENYTEARSKDRLDALDAWVRGNLTPDAVTKYDEQVDKQRALLAKAQLRELEDKALAKTAAAEAGVAAPPAAPVVKIKAKAEPKPKAPPKPKRQQTLEQLANRSARETAGAETELEKDIQRSERKLTETQRIAEQARARAAEEAVSTAKFLEEDKAKRAAAAAARAAVPPPAETPAITKPEKPKEEVKKEEAPTKPSGNLPKGKPPQNTIVFGKDPGDGSSYLAQAVQNYGDMIVNTQRGSIEIEFTPPLEITNYTVNYVNLQPNRVSISLNSNRTGDPFRIVLGVVPRDTGLNYLDLTDLNKDRDYSLTRNKPNSDLEQKFRAAIGDAAVDNFLNGGELTTFITNVIGVDLTPRIEEMYAAFDKQYLVNNPAQYAEGVAYKPLSEDFPISREDFARALGITQHSKAWLATDFNAELADAVTRGDMPAVIKALLASKNPIVRDIAQRAQATQRFIPSERIKVKIADDELAEVDLEKGRQPGSLAGMFDGGSNTVLVNSVYAGSEHTIAHEIVHGLTERIIRTPLSGNQLEGVNRLKKLYKEVLAKAKIVYETDDLKKLPYGFTSESEFIAEGLSNPEFQYLLAALPHEGKTSSMWTEFVRAIAQILGLKDHNALTELLDIYSVMLTQGPIKSNQSVSGAVRAELIGAIPPNNNYPLVPDDLPDSAKVPATISTPPAALPQVAVNRTMQGPADSYLKAATDSELYINAMDQVGRSALSVQPMWYIADTARKLGFDQIGKIENSLRKAGAMKNTLLKRSSDFMTKALAIAKSDPAGKKAMDAFVNRASGLAIDVTRSKDPSPEFVKARPDSVADYVSLRAEYDKLHPKFQTLASDLVNQYRQFRDDYFTALKKSVHDQYQDDPVKADKILSGLDEKYKKFNEAYTPFVRIGDYWITYVNPDTGKDVAESYTSLGAQKTRLDELKKEGIVHVQSFKQTDFRKFSYKSGPVNQFFDEIKANVDKALPIYKDDTTATADRIREAREEMKERLYQASLLLHPESSMLRQFGLERKGTLGYIEDTLAAYDHKAPVYATQISQVAHKGEIEHQIDSARKQNASNPDTKMSDIITHTAKIVYGVDTIRSDDPLNQIANNVNRLGFTFYMGFNPASALVNLLQTPTVMFPLLAGEFHGLGQSKIMNTLFSAMTKIIGGSVGEKTYGEKLVESAEAKIDAAVAKGKTREEAIAALPEMERVFLSFRDQGILNAGDPSHDFGSVTKHGSGETSAFGKGVRAFTKYSAIMFQRAEAINREAGALATYQLMKQRLSGKADMSSQDKYVEAIRKATDMVTRAHGDYQHGLAPKIFLSPTMRVIFMFKKFPAHMAALYVRLFKDMFSKADPEVRKVARIQFAGLMGMSGLFAGTMGMPFYYIIRDMMNLMLDDEDDPYDFDFAFYNYLSDMWGQPMANRITRGWLGDLGGDIASKVGYASSPLLGGSKQLPFIGGLLGLRDGKNTASAEDDLKNYVAEAAGASAGMALQIARGVDKLAQGDVYRFLEGVTPMAGMRNIAKSIRLSKEGALTTRGEPIIEDVGLTETALQAVGFTPQRLAGQYQLNAWQKDAEKQILDRRQSLINQKFNARAKQDYDTESDVNDEIQKFNMLNPEKGLKITSETLTASARTRAQQSKDTKAGIYLSKPFRQRFADVPVYAEE